MVEITKIVFPDDNRSDYQRKLFNLVEEYLKNLRTTILEEMYCLQKDKKTKKYFIEKLKERYLQELEIDNSEEFGKLKEYVFSFYLFETGSYTLTKEEKEYMVIKKQKMNDFLRIQDFKKIVKMYSELVTDGQDYNGYYVPTLFAPLIIEKVNEKESLDIIRDACYPHNENTVLLITNKVQEKLDIILNYEE